MKVNKQSIIMAKEQLAGSKELALNSLELNSGIYFLYDDDELVYIGQAYNISRRVMDHLCEGTKKFNKVRYNLVPQISLNDVEYTLIKALKPKYNNTKQSDYKSKPTSKSTIVFRAVALAHWERRKTGAIPVRIRFTYKRRYFYYPTNLTAYPEHVEKGTVVDPEILKDLEPIFKKCKNAIKYISTDKSFEYVKNKIMSMSL